MCGLISSRFDSFACLYSCQVQSWPTSRIGSWTGALLQLLMLVCGALFVFVDHLSCHSPSLSTQTMAVRPICSGTSPQLTSQRKLLPKGKPLCRVAFHLHFNVTRFRHWQSLFSVTNQLPTYGRNEPFVANLGGPRASVTPHPHYSEIFYAQFMLICLYSSRCSPAVKRTEKIKNSTKSSNAVSNQSTSILLWAGLGIYTRFFPHWPGIV